MKIVFRFDRRLARWQLGGEWSRTWNTQLWRSGRDVIRDVHCDISTIREILFCIKLSRDRLESKDGECPQMRSHIGSIVLKVTETNIVGSISGIVKCSVL